jgi:hypothetical protein
LPAVYPVGPFVSVNRSGLSQTSASMRLSKKEPS